MIASIEALSRSTNFSFAARRFGMYNSQVPVSSGLLNDATPTDRLPINDVIDRIATDVIDRIATWNFGLNSFWSEIWGWAPNEAAELLSQARLDWQVSLPEFTPKAYCWSVVMIRTVWSRS